MLFSCFIFNESFLDSILLICDLNFDFDFVNLTLHMGVCMTKMLEQPSGVLAE